MAAKSGERPALNIPRGRDANGKIDYLVLTFRELAQEQDNWGRHLLGKGIGRGSRVLLMARPGLPLIALCFALFKIGAVPIVIDPGMGLRSFLSCVRRSKPDALVGISLAIWVSRIFRGSFKSLRSRVKVGGPLARAPLPKGNEELSGAETTARDLAAILFTSGSTGPPKGVCYEHGMFEAQVSAIREHYGITAGETDLPMLPIFALFNPALGMTTVVPEINPSKPATVDPAKVVQAIQQCGVTNSFGSPVLWKKIGAYCTERSETLPSLKRILMAGASVPPQLMQQFRKILVEGHVHSPYGATEVLPVSSIADTEVLGETAALTEQGKGTCVGRPLPGVEVKILKVSDEPLEASDLDTPLPQWEIGEIVATGPSVTREYDGLPEATREAKIDCEGRVWHRMGDLGYFDPQGRIWFCGRKAERVEAAGKTYYSDCCEGVFNSLPNVFRTALIGLQRNGQSIPAIVVEPLENAFPQSEKERTQFIEGLQSAAATTSVTSDIETFLFDRAFPVDVRHNAKINRLVLGRRMNEQQD